VARLDHNPLLAFLGPDDITFKGPLDIEYFERVPNADIARAKLAWIMRPANEIELRKRHDPEEVARMWRAVFRGCLMFGVPIPDKLKPYGRAIGVVFPE